METNLYQEDLYTETQATEWITNWTYPEITMDSICVTNTIQPLVIKHEYPSSMNTIRSVDFLLLFLILLNILFTWLNGYKPNDNIGKSDNE